MFFSFPVTGVSGGKLVLTKAVAWVCRNLMENTKAQAFSLTNYYCKILEPTVKSTVGNFVCERHKQLLK